MSRNQVTLSAIGGVFVLGAAVLGWFLYGAISACGEAREERDGSMEQIDSFYRSKVFPSAQSLDAVKSNAAEFAEWRANANALAQRGDRSFGPTTAPSFKQHLQSERVRLASLGGTVNGKIAAEGFLFGFDKYLGQNQTMPAEADLPKLQRQLEFVSAMMNLFAESKIDEIKSVKRDETPLAAADASLDAELAPKGGRKGKEEDESAVTSLDYSFQFLATPEALVNVLNRLNSEFRFVVVKNFEFVESADRIVEKFTQRDAALRDAQAGNERRRSSRRRGAAVEEQVVKTPEQTQAAKDAERIVIAPELDAPLTVDLTVTVYDFGTGTVAAEKPAEPAVEAAEGAQAGESAVEKPAEETKPAEEAKAPEAGEAKEETAK